MSKDKKTSETDPLQIAELPAGDGLIGVTLCPGKQGDSVFGRSWERSLEADVAAIVNWGATAVVTLIEEDEFRMLKVEALPELVQAAGLEWHWLPIADVKVPDGRFARRWVYAGLRVRERLRAGERVLVHCRGGLGRAGMVAARLLAEFGLEPASAIRAVRSVRPGAIETSAQEAWVLETEALDRAREERSSRELACLLGGALGDALGYRVEFDRLSEIRRRYGEEGIALAKASGDLVVSDDTQMSLFTLEGQGRSARDRVPIVDGIRQAYLEWYRTQTGRRPGGAKKAAVGLLAHSAMWQSRAPGNTCLSALQAGGRGTPEEPINDSKGCGGVMRTAPLGFLGEGVRDGVLYVQGVAAAALTHGHPDGWAPAGVMALAVRQLIEAHEWYEVAGSGLAVLLAAHPQATGTVDLLEQVHAAITPGGTPRASASFGQGWVGDEALAVGLHAAATAGSFAEAIEVAANHDGDSDSTASIAGQLYGAKHGLSSLPAEAVYRVDVLEALLEVYGEWQRVDRGVEL
jgi:ADP-ribosylglycohydrolase/protein-tyrosine phosphatase